MTNKIRLGLLGCGWISERHVNGYKFLMEKGCPEFEVTACCDNRKELAQSRAKEIAEFQGGTTPKVFTDMEKMATCDIVDAVDICLPHHLHHTAAVSLLEAGLHVLVEKPLGITLKAGQKVIEAGEKCRRIVAVAENTRRYLPARAAEWGINKAKLAGDIYTMSIQFITHAPFNYENPTFKWRGVKLLVGGGMIMDSGHHFADMMLHLFGEVDEVYCLMGTIDKRVIRGLPVLGETPADVEDCWHAVFRFTNGKYATWTYSRSFYGEPINSGLYYGSSGTVKDKGFPFHCFQDGGDFILGDGKILTGKKVCNQYLKSLSSEDKEQLFPYGCNDGFGIEVWDFLNAIKNNRKPEIDGAEGLKIMALCEACYESATAGKPVKYREVLDGSLATYQKPINDFWKI